MNGFYRIKNLTKKTIAVASSTHV